MHKSLACLVHGLIVVAAWHCTHSVSGFAVTAAGLMLLADRYSLRLVPWPTISWKREVFIRSVSWLAGGLAFYIMRPGIVDIQEAAYRGFMVSLVVALFEQAPSAMVRLGAQAWHARLVTGCVVGGIAVTVPVIAGLHPLHTVPKRTPAAWGFDFEEVRFQATDGARLAGWLVPHAQPCGNVVFCHGHGRNRGHVAGQLQTLHDMGLNVLAFDFRGHGDSEGHTCTFGQREVEDVRAAVRYLTNRFPNQPLILIGISMGAAVALQALPHLPHVDGVWCEGAFANLTSAVEQELWPVPIPLRPPLLGCYYVLGWLDTSVWAPAINPIDCLDGVSVPIYFCHAVKDEVVPIRDGKALYASYTGPKEAWWVQDASHYDVRQRDREEYLGRLRGFIEGCLSQGRMQSAHAPGISPPVVSPRPG
jgi:alpha-beta hydrolase superfamily lysophospholipase